MARSYAYLSLLFGGGTLIALLVTGNFWPLICAVAALYFLRPVFFPNLEQEPSPKQAPKYYKGRKDRRFPS